METAAATIRIVTAHRWQLDLSIASRKSGTSESSPRFCRFFAAPSGAKLRERHRSEHLHDIHAFASFVIEKNLDTTQYYSPKLLHHIRYVAQPRSTPYNPLRQEFKRWIHVMPHHQPPFPWRYLALALAVYSALQLLFLGLAPISGSTEAREAQVIDTIIRDGEWVLPLRNGIIPSKPPLFHWIGAVMSQVFGHVSELTVRLPSHLAALGVVFFSSLAAFRVARFSQTVEGELHQERVALLTPAILTLIYGFHQLASQAMVDMTFSFFVWGAIASLLLTDPEKWRSEHAISPRSRSCFWICLAGAVVARGPVGLALPTFIIGITSWFLGGLKATLREFLKPSLGWFAFLLPAAWYYAAFLQGGEAFLARQLLFENVQRFVGGEKINTESWWFYLPSLARTTAPFGLLMLWGFSSI